MRPDYKSEDYKRKSLFYFGNYMSQMVNSYYTSNGKEGRDELGQALEPFEDDDDFKSEKIFDLGQTNRAYPKGNEQQIKNNCKQFYNKIKEKHDAIRKESNQFDGILGLIETMTNPESGDLLRLEIENPNLYTLVSMLNSAPDFNKLTPKQIADNLGPEISDGLNSFYEAVNSMVKCEYAKQKGIDRGWSKEEQENNNSSYIMAAEELDKAYKKLVSAHKAANEKNPGCEFNLGSGGVLQNMLSVFTEVNVDNTGRDDVSPCVESFVQGGKSVEFGKWPEEQKFIPEYLGHTRQKINYIDRLFSEGRYKDKIVPENYIQFKNEFNALYNEISEKALNNNFDKWNAVDKVTEFNNKYKNFKVHDSVLQNNQELYDYKFENAQHPYKGKTKGQMLDAVNKEFSRVSGGSSSKHFDAFAEKFKTFIKLGKQMNGKETTPEILEQYLAAAKDVKLTAHLYNHYKEKEEYKYSLEHNGNKLRRSTKTQGRIDFAKNVSDKVDMLVYELAGPQRNSLLSHHAEKEVQSLSRKGIENNPVKFLQDNSLTTGFRKNDPEFFIKIKQYSDDVDKTTGWQLNRRSSFENNMKCWLISKGVLNKDNFFDYNKRPENEIKQHFEEFYKEFKEARDNGKIVDFIASVHQAAIKEFKDYSFPKEKIDSLDKMKEHMDKMDAYGQIFIDLDQDFDHIRTNHRDVYDQYRNKYPGLDENVTAFSMALQSVNNPMRTISDKSLGAQVFILSEYDKVYNTYYAGKNLSEFSDFNNTLQLFSKCTDRLQPDKLDEFTYNNIDKKAWSAIENALRTGEKLDDANAYIQALKEEPDFSTGKLKTFYANLNGKTKDKPELSDVQKNIDKLAFYRDEKNFSPMSEQYYKLLGDTVSSCLNYKVKMDNSANRMSEKDKQLYKLNDRILSSVSSELSKLDKIYRAGKALGLETPKVRTFNVEPEMFASVREFNKFRDNEISQMNIDNLSSNADELNRFRFINSLDSKIKPVEVIRDEGKLFSNVKRPMTASALNDLVQSDQNLKTVFADENSFAEKLDEFSDKMMGMDEMKPSERLNFVRKKASLDKSNMNPGSDEYIDSLYNIATYNYVSKHVAPKEDTPENEIPERENNINRLFALEGKNDPFDKFKDGYFGKEFKKFVEKELKNCDDLSEAQLMKCVANSIRTASEKIAVDVFTINNNMPIADKKEAMKELEQLKKFSDGFKLANNDVLTAKNINGLNDSLKDQEMKANAKNNNAKKGDLVM